MEKVIVRIMNWHGVFPHVDIMLEHQSAYYYINPWAKPALAFEPYLKVIAPTNVREAGVIEADPIEIINAANSNYVFDIQAHPKDIAAAWINYYHYTQTKITENHCATATQWFLTTFADIPAPSVISAPMSLNNLTRSLFFDKIITETIMPSRIINNAKFYVEAKKNPELTQQYTGLLLQVCAAIYSLALANRATSLAVALMYLQSPHSFIPEANAAKTGLFKTTEPLTSEPHRGCGQQMVKNVLSL